MVIWSRPAAARGAALCHKHGGDPKHQGHNTRKGFMFEL